MSFKSVKVMITVSKYSLAELALFKLEAINTVLLGAVQIPRDSCGRRGIGEIT